jgi:outer membrane protein assembly factor BamD (BamD/ComL family)
MTLADELETLKRAQSALDAGDARRALTTLDRYDRAAKGQRLRAEATVLRIEALSRAGQHGAAAALARRFVDQNPESPLVDRARSFIAKDPSAAGGQPGKEE